MLITNLGLFWEEEDVFWGAGSQAGKLLGVPSGKKREDPIDFREQIGIYVLYAGYDVVYAGQAGSGDQKLFTRLKQHRIDDLAGRWNRFSWFGIRRVLGSGALSAHKSNAHPKIKDVLNHIEAILIHSMEPPLNRQGGRFGENVTRYLQVRDDRLGPSDSEVLKGIHEKIQNL